MRAADASPEAAPHLNTIDALILNCSTTYVCGCACARAPSAAELAGKDFFPSQHRCATNQDQSISQHWVVTGGSLIPPYGLFIGSADL